MANLKDVAKRADVSIASVSRVIHNKGYVTEEMREKVQRAITELNYHPNQNARSLRFQTTNLIGLIMTNPFDNPYYGAIAKGVHEECHRQGFSALIFTVRDAEEEFEAVKVAISRRPDGILFSTILNRKSLDFLQEFQIPVVLIERFFQAENIGKVGFDNYQGSRMAISYLVELGHREIVFLGSVDSMNETDNFEVDRDRLQGYKDALRQHGLAPVDSRIRLDQYSVHSGGQMMEDLLRMQVPFSAVLAESDNIALGACNALYRNGLKVPEDVSVMGFENLLGQYFVKPPTVIDQSVWEMGRQSAQLLIEHIESKEAFDSSEVLLLPKLVVGETTAPLSVS